MDEGDPLAICQDSASSWIILPRVSQFIEEEHSAYLLCYLNYLASEPASEFRRILTRIIIEFVGNYASKFRNSIFPSCRIDSALFYGYEAMFWKNIINPPQGFEDDLIFNHCLRWIKLFRSRCDDINDDMAQSIRQMEAYQQKVMLIGNALHSTDDENEHLNSVFITLRHGRPGMAAAVDFMGNWLCLAGKDSAGRSFYALLPATLNEFFNTIKRKFPAESPAVQNSLRKFLRRLKDNFASHGIEGMGNSNNSPEQFRFVIRRVLGLVDGLTASLA